VELAVLLLVGIAIGVIKSSLSKTRQKENKYSYRKKDFLISRAEHELMDLLDKAFGNIYYIFPQVHLPSLLNHKVVGQNWHGAFRHIDEKSVDFVICDKQYIKPLLAIELDDKSHEQEERMARDVEVEEILKNAGLPLLRVENHGHFDRIKIIQQISTILDKG
jgi:very-short-patch-repair endonuclease